MLEYYNMYQSRRELLDYEKYMRDMKTGFNFSKEKEYEKKSISNEKLSIKQEERGLK